MHPQMPGTRADGDPGRVRSRIGGPLLRSISNRLMLAMLAMLSLATGCTSAGSPRFVSPGQGGPEGFPQDMDITVTIRNEHWRPVRVWVEWPRAQRYFLGEIAADDRGSFQIHWAALEQLGAFQLYAKPLGSADEVSTGTIDLRGNHRIEWVLHRVLGMSRPRIW